MGGKRVGEWEVLGELARGGQGVVLRARHAVHGTPAALKLLLRVEQRTVLRFRQEAAVLLRLNHPNLVRVFEVGEHEAAPFLAMELVTGQSLADLVREGGALRPARATKLLAAVARAVHHCHALGVVHRDLKPENVIVERGTDRPVLVDFGLVKRDRELFGALSIDELSRLSRSGELRGTPMYMAPEQVSPGGEHGEVGPWTDVHALGSVLHVLLTGEAPHEADSLPDLLRAVLTEPPADPRATNPAVPAHLAQLCLQARARDPKARPRSAAAFAAALERAPAAGGRRAVVALAALAVVGGASGAALVVRGDHEVAPVATAAPAPIVTAHAVAEAPAEEPDALVERALATLEAGHPAEALGLAEQALEAQPGLRARAVRAVALLRGARGERTEEPLMELVAADPTLGWALRDGAPDPRLIEAWVVRGLRRLRIGDHEGALADCALALGLRPDDPRAKLLRVEIHLERDDPRAALEDLAPALASAPHVARLWGLRAEARLRQGDAEGALADVAEARRRDRAEGDPLCTAARAHATLGDHEGAVAELTRDLTARGRDELLVRTLRGLELMALRRDADALADLEAALRLAPRNERALSARGLLRWRTGELDLARADWAAADLILADATPAARAEALLERAGLRRSAGDHEGALRDIDGAVALASGWRARTVRGALLFSAERYQDALADFEAALVVQPDVPDALIGRGQCKHALGDAKGALADLDRALDRASVEAATVHLVRAFVHLTLGDTKAALADASRCIELAPRQPDGWLGRASIKKQAGDLPGALADLDEAVRLAPAGDHRALIDRAEARRLSNDGPGAVADAAKVVELEPTSAAAWHALGLSHRLAGDEPAAWKAFDRAVELSGAVAAAAPSLQHRATSKRLAKDYPGAEADLLRAIELRPGWWGAWYDLGITRNLAGDVAGALTAHTRAIELGAGKDLVSPLLARAALLRVVKELPAALADAERALELDPGRWDAWNGRGWTRYVARTDKDHAGALADLGRAIELGPDQFAPWRNRAWVRRALRDYSGAEADASQALERSPKDGETWVFRGGLRQRRLDGAGAIEDFTRALDLGYVPASTLRQRATARRDVGDLEGALADLAAALEKDPRAVDAFVIRAALRREYWLDLDGALEDDDAAVAIDPASASARRSRSLTRLERGDAAGARADADEAVRLSPAANEVHASRARVRIGLSDLAGARADAERAVALDPLSSYAHWSLGLALLAAGDATGAIAACDSSIATDARVPRAHATRAEALVRLGRRTEALADLGRAVPLEPGRADALLARAALREQTGDRAGAAADLREALTRLRPGDPRRRTTSAALARLTP